MSKLTTYTNSECASYVLGPVYRTGVWGGIGYAIFREAGGIVGALLGASSGAVASAIRAYKTKKIREIPIEERYDAITDEIFDMDRQRYKAFKALTREAGWAIKNAKRNEGDGPLSESLRNYLKEIKSHMLSEHEEAEEKLSDVEDDRGLIDHPIIKGLGTFGYKQIKNKAMSTIKNIDKLGIINSDGDY